MQIQYVHDSFPEYLGKKDHISASDVKNFLKSPKYYKYMLTAKKEKKDEDRHLTIGTAIHKFILEGESFWEDYFITQKIDKRTNEGKKKALEIELTNSGKIGLEPDEIEIITNIGNSALENETLTELIKDSYREVSIYTVDEKTGLKVRLRPDVYCKNKSTIVDLKSCVSSQPIKFRRDVFKFDYPISGAFYLDFTGKENYLFCALEKDAPNQVSLFALSDELMQRAREDYRMALDLIKWSIDNNYWCDYVEFDMLKNFYKLETLDTALKEIKKAHKIIILT